MGALARNSPLLKTPGPPATKCEYPLKQQKTVLNRAGEKDKAIAALIKAQEKGINPLKWQQNIAMLSSFAAIVAEYDPTVEERDYKDEYKKFQSSEKMRKYRAELNRYNRKKGTYGNGDGKDASHKDGKIVGMEDQSVNRGRAEKSRLIGSKRK